MNKLKPDIFTQIKCTVPKQELCVFILTLVKVTDYACTDFKNAYEVLIRVLRESQIINLVGGGVFYMKGGYQRRLYFYAALR